MDGEVSCLGRGEEVEALDAPMVVVVVHEICNGLVDLLGVSEDTAVDSLLLEGLDEALGDAVALGLGDEGEALGDAPVGDLVEEVVAGVLAPVVPGRGQEKRRFGHGGQEGKAR